jgi:type IV pilus assembly protein PilB
VRHVKEKKKLGEMLIDGGLLTEAQLNQSVIDHKRSNIKLGEYLVREGIVSSSEIVDLVSRQLAIEKYSRKPTPLRSPCRMSSPLNCARNINWYPLNERATCSKSP